MPSVALTVESGGVLRAASAGIGEDDGWQDPDSIGNATLVPGSAGDRL